MSEEKNENDFWSCKCCGVVVDDNSERKVLPLSLGSGDENSLTLFVCPNCYTLQIPEIMFEDLHRRITSRIIT